MRPLVLILLFFLSAGPVRAMDAPGMAVLPVADAKGGRDLALSLWYPAHGGSAQVVGGNAVFLGQKAAPGAAAGEGPFPLVLLSHGGVRSSPDSGAWLAAALAGSGHIVVEVNAPRPTSARAGADEIWRRPQDLARALAAVLGDPQWARRIDRSRISAVGFALGGTAALVASGRRIDPDAFRRSCTDMTGPDCGWYAAGGIALETLDRAPLERAYRIPGLSAVVAIAPEYPDVVANEGEASTVPSLVIALGANGEAEARLAPLAGHDGTARLVTLAKAGPFDAFPLCAPAGAKILSEDGGDPALCGTAPQARGDIHAEIADRIRAFLAQTVK
ncbi:alpha/beta hydrolase family protein [Stappia sp.]|uniref:alpha/beta hydrolase family protein n=1 Tax=Stappia sp. TaxID=1870903 RepID=UPI003C7A9E6C